MFLRYIVKNKWIFRSLFKTIIFNFHYLPFKQAIKLPIFVYKLKFVKWGGVVEIPSSVHLKTGMIKLGVNRVSIYPNTGIIWENNGGKVTFEGTCNIGGNSAISVGNNGILTIGNNFSASTSLKLVCYNKVTLGKDVEFGWDCICMDTDFHRMKLVDGGYTIGFGFVNIGNGNWFANRCTVLKNTVTAEYCTFSSSSVVSGKYEDSHSVYGSSAISLKRRGIYRDRMDDRIIY